MEKSFYQLTGSQIELDFPIKLIYGENKNIIMELKNIEMGDKDDAKFKVPDAT